MKEENGLDHFSGILKEKDTEQLAVVRERLSFERIKHEDEINFEGKNLRRENEN